MGKNLCWSDGQWLLHGLSTLRCDVVESGFSTTRQRHTVGQSANEVFLSFSEKVAAGGRETTGCDCECESQGQVHGGRL